jgi:hypothetical protein
VSRRLLVALVPLGIVSACASAGEVGVGERTGSVGEPLAADCTASVKGQGTLDVEAVYLPDVVHCENGGAPLESLKAQAIAARTYLYYKLETAGTITDGQGDQVYSCGSHATALEKQAVLETAGQVLRYSGVTIAAFYVAGGASSPPACHDASSSTSADVTYNAGKRGAGVTQTPLGLVNPTNLRNRGCMSQLGSRCLAKQGSDHLAILRFYYGDDIELVQATGPCVPVAPDAGDASAPDGAAAADAAADPALGDASEAPADPSAAPEADASSGCAAAPRRGAPAPFGWLVGALAWLALGRRRRAVRGTGCRSKCG